MYVIFYTFLTLIPPNSAAPPCIDALKTFVAFDDQQHQLGRIQALHQIFSNSRYEADEIKIFYKALDQMFERGERIPQARFLSRFSFAEERQILSEENKIIGDYWLSLIPSREFVSPIETHLVTDELRLVRDKSKAEGLLIEKVEVKNVPLILRTQIGRSDLGALRKTAAASKLNEMMRLQTTPRSRWVRLFDRLSLASTYLSGAHPTSYTRSQYDPWSVSDLEAFEFLAGQTDGSELNTKECQDSTLKIFDHDHAFIATVPLASGFCLAGGKLPEEYSSRFIKSLKTLKRSDLVRHLGHLLTIDEIDFIMLRREILLLDFESHRDTKLIYGH